MLRHICGRRNKESLESLKEVFFFVLVESKSEDVEFVVAVVVVVLKIKEDHVEILRNVGIHCLFIESNELIYFLLKMRVFVSLRFELVESVVEERVASVFEFLLFLANFLDLGRRWVGEETLRCIWFVCGCKGVRKNRLSPVEMSRSSIFG